MKAQNLRTRSFLTDTSRKELGIGLLSSGSHFGETGLKVLALLYYCYFMCTIRLFPPPPTTFTVNSMIKFHGERGMENTYRELKYY